MLILLVKVGTLPQQIDDFPDGCERSCRGSLHVKSGTLMVTAGEWEHIQKSRPDLASCMVDATPPVSPSPRVRSVLAPDPGTEPEADPEAEKSTVIPGSEPSAPTSSKPKKRTRRGGSFPNAD